MMWRWKREEKDLEEKEEGVSHRPRLRRLGLFHSLKFIVSLSINQPLPLVPANPGPELPAATDLFPLRVYEGRPSKVAAEVTPDPRTGEARGITLHPLQLSGPKSVQGSGMPEPGSRQLGSCLASGCLPGNNALPILLISKDFKLRHGCLCILLLA